MNPRQLPEILRKSASRDIVIIGFVTIVLVILGLTVHWTESSIEFMYRHEDSPADDIALPLVVTAVLLMVFSFRRNREYVRVIRHSQSTLKQLDKTNRRLNKLLHSSSAIIFNRKADDDFTVLYMSDNITAILGYSMEDVMAPGFWKSNLHPDEIEKLLKDRQIKFQESGHWIKEYRFRHKNGSWRWMHADVNVFFHEGGEPTEIVGVWLDITEKKNTQEAIRQSEERLQYASLATRDVLYDVNLLTGQPWYSDQVFSSLGYPKSTAFTADWWSLHLHPDERESTMERSENHLAQKKQTYSAEYRFRKGDGSYADIVDRAYIIYDEAGTPLRWIGSMYDITAIKKTEAELRQAKEKAEISMKAKSEFLANMSHEIRTPLNGILGMTEIALDTNLNADQKRYLEIVKTSCHSLMSLINDILDFSKIDAGKLELSTAPFSLRDELPQVMQPLGLKASEKHLEFVVSIGDDVPDRMLGDFFRLHQIITNLVGNAIKFTHKGQILLDVVLLTQTDHQATLKFSVVDTGIGIPQHKRKAIFEEFTQVDGSTTRQYGGTGLGLSITKKLVELMSGSVWVESEENRGSAFYFTAVLELQKHEQKPRFTALPVVENTPVLVVEDNPLSRNHLLHLLENFQMKPHGVASGDEAIAALRKQQEVGRPYPLLILDLYLDSQMDGFDVAEFVKTDPALQHTNIIVVSMSHKASDRERMSVLGINQYFNKPFSQSDLLDAIQNSLVETMPGSVGNTTTSLTDFSGFETSPAIYKILVVEDNLVNQEVASSMLKKKGHTVVIANDGKEALSLFQKERFDFILMDVQMPRMNGYEATMKIRQLEQISGDHTMIIGLTANAMKGDRENCLNAGMDHYLSKPIRMNELFSAIEITNSKSANMSKTSIDSNASVCLVNLKPLLENLDGDKAVLEEVLKQYEPRARQQLEAIEEFLLSGNIAGVVMPAHSLKGQSMHIEMHDVICLAAKMEEYALESKITEARELLPFLQSGLTNGLRALEQAMIELHQPG